MIRAVLYARVPSLSFDMAPQVSGLENFIRSRGWNIVGQYGDVASGDDPRPNWRALLADAGANRFDVVVIWNFLFASSADQFITALDRFNALGVGLVSVTEKFDSRSDVGKLTTAAMRAFYEFERRRRGERVSLALEARRSRGLAIGRPGRKDLSEDKVRADYAVMGSIRKTARLNGCSRDTVRRILAGRRKSTSRAA